MVIIIGILFMIILLLMGYIAFFQIQLRSMNQQMSKRFLEHTRQPISIELFNKQLNHLAHNINQFFKAEEVLRLEVVGEEKRFKEMIANISHDLRTPLTAIKGYQQLMEKEELTANQLQKLHIAQKHARALEELIEQFYQYSSALTADIHIHWERINLTNLVTECLAEYVASFEKEGMSVIVEEDNAVYAYADRLLTIRVIQNLIRNCLTHGEGHIRVKVYTDQYAILSFNNTVSNGSSIDINRLFDRFYTGDKARGNGAGLGLSIVRQLTEKMDGHVNATLDGSELGICVALRGY